MKINKKIKQQAATCYSSSKAFALFIKTYSEPPVLSQPHLMEQFAKLGNDRPD